MPKIVGKSLADHRDKVRGKLFAALAALLRDRGYDAVTLADIAAEAGVGRTAMYNHFPDKESVLLAMIESETAGYLERLDAALATTDDPIAALEIFLRTQLAELADQQHMDMLGLASALSDEGNARLRDHIAPMAARLAQILSDALEQGCIPQQDLRALGALVSSATMNHALTGIDGPQRDAVVDATVTFVLRGVGAVVTAGR